MIINKQRLYRKEHLFWWRIHRKYQESVICVVNITAGLHIHADDGYVMFVEIK